METFADDPDFNYLAPSISESESDADEYSPHIKRDPESHSDDDVVTGRRLRDRRKIRPVISDSEKEDDQVDDITGASKPHASKKKSTKSDWKSTANIARPLLGYDLLLGVWKASKPMLEVDKMAVYGGWWTNKAVKFQIFKFTTDGRPVEGDFPLVESRRCPWVKYKDIELLPELAHLNEKQLKQHVREHVKPLQGRRHGIAASRSNNPFPAHGTTTTVHQIQPSPQEHKDKSGSLPTHQETNFNEKIPFHVNVSREPSHEKPSAEPTTPPAQINTVLTESQETKDTIHTCATSQDDAMGVTNGKITTSVPQDTEVATLSRDTSADQQTQPNSDNATSLPNVGGIVDNQHVSKLHHSSQLVTPQPSTTSSNHSSPNLSNTPTNTSTGTMPPTGKDRVSRPSHRLQTSSNRNTQSPTPRSPSTFSENSGRPSNLGKRFRPTDESSQEHERRPPPSRRSVSGSDLQSPRPEEPKVPEPTFLANEKLPRYTEQEIEDYRKHWASRNRDIAKISKQQIVLTMLGSLYPDIVKENRAMGREPKIAVDSPVPKPTRDFLFSSGEVRAYRSYSLETKKEDTADLADVQVVTIMLGELYRAEAELKRAAEKKNEMDETRVEEAASTTPSSEPQVQSKVDSPGNLPTSGDAGAAAALENLSAIPTKQPDQEAVDGSWIRVNNVTYIRYKEEPVKDKFLSAPYEVSKLDGVEIISYSRLEIVKKKFILEFKEAKYHKVPQVPRIIERKPVLRRRKLRLHDSEVDPAASFVRMEGFVEIGDKWVKPVHVIEQIQDDSSDDEGGGQDGDGDHIMETKS